MKRYGKISILVQSGDFYRVFETESFSIRPCVNHLQRYNPTYKIVAVCYGEFVDCQADNTQWRECRITGIHYNGTLVEKAPEVENLKTYLLENYDYRTALTMWYAHCAENGIYPSKTAFKGVTVGSVPEEIHQVIGDCKHPKFLPDTENPLDEKSDVLKYYDGRRIERMLRGELVEGYLLTACRISGKTETENE